MLTLVKLGGSLITDKRVEKSFRRDVVKRLADEIAAARAVDPELKLLIGHGSGSFGHFAAKRANTLRWCSPGTGGTNSIAGTPLIEWPAGSASLIFCRTLWPALCSAPHRGCLLRRHNSTAYFAN